MRNFGLWVSNGPPQDMDALLRLVKDGAYTVLHEGAGAEQARKIVAQHPGATILVRHHCPDWPTTDPLRWAQEVAGRMASDYAPLGITRVVGANEPNLEPAPNFTEENYRAFGRWYRAFAAEIKRLTPALLVHFPAWAAGHSEDQNDLGFVGYLLPEVVGAIRLGDAVNCHCYWDVNEGPLREMGGFGGGLRYRKVRALLRANNILYRGGDYPLWIDEAGPWAEPWRVEQTAAHTEACARDGVTVTYFLWADPTNHPGNTINQWHGRIPGDKLNWLIGEWDRIATLPPPVVSNNLPGSPGVVDVVDKLERHPTERYQTRDLYAIRRVVIHHSAARGTIGPEAIARYHVRTNGWPGIGYHYYIPADGTVYQTNRLTTISYHAREANADSVGVCFGGDFTKGKPTDAQVESGKWLLKKLREMLGDVAVVGHSDIVQTACPGGTWWRELLPEDDRQIRLAVDEIERALARVEKALLVLAAATDEMKAARQEALDARRRLLDNVIAPLYRNWLGKV